MNRFHLLPAAVGIFALLLLSCSNNPVYDEVYSFDDEVWNSKSPLNFKVAISDTTRSYDLFFHIRTKKTYAYSNIWFFLQTTGPNGASIHDTLEVELADKSGRWLGSGIGNVNAMLVPYLTSVKFAQRGVYEVTVVHAMREELLTDILNVGLRIGYSE